MTSKFDLRRTLLLGALGSGLATVLASCESAYEAYPPDEPEPYAERRRPRKPRRVIYPREPREPEMAEPRRQGSGSSGGGGGGGGNGGGGNGGGGSNGGGGWGSDRRLKTAISAIGRSPSGLTIYRFQYIWGGPTFVGVMAQDLLLTRPEAIIVTDSGYFMVDYDRIDVKMMALADYKAARKDCLRVAAPPKANLLAIEAFHPARGLDHKVRRGRYDSAA